jgi:hypothetical protein
VSSASKPIVSIKGFSSQDEVLKVADPDVEILYNADIGWYLSCISRFSSKCVIFKSHIKVFPCII